MSDLSMLPTIIAELQKQYGMIYEETIYLEDEQGERHLFFVATIRGARVFFDESGQIWMTEAEIARVTDMSKQAVRNAIRRLADSDLGEAICQVHNLFTSNRRGQKRLLTFYDEETVAAIITRGRGQSNKALEFLAERKAIIYAVRLLAHRYALATYEENQQLVDKLDHLSNAFEEEKQLRLTAERRVEDAEQNANDVQRELLEMRYGDLDTYDEK
jgi:phage regulator Rha-like protein